MSSKIIPNSKVITDSQFGDLQARLGVLRNKVFLALDGVGKVVFGEQMREVAKKLFTAIIAFDHVLVEGVPGTAKTELCNSTGKAIGGRFRSKQFHSELGPTDLQGYFDHNQIFIDGTITEDLDLLLADEVNRAQTRTNAALLEAMQERKMELKNKHVIKVSDHFTVMATLNPLEFEDTYPLPEAMLDRFALKLIVELPDKATFKKIMASEKFAPTTAYKFELIPEPLITLDEITEIGVLLHDYFESLILPDGYDDMWGGLEYIARIFDWFKDEYYKEGQSQLANGISPRALARKMHLLSKVSAFLEPDSDWDMLSMPKHVKTLLPDFLRHRITLQPAIAHNHTKSQEVVAEFTARCIKELNTKPNRGNSLFNLA